MAGSQCPHGCRQRVKWQRADANTSPGKSPVGQLKVGPWMSKATRNCAWLGQRRSAFGRTILSCRKEQEHEKEARWRNHVTEAREGWTENVRGRPRTPNRSGHVWPRRGLHHGL